MNIKKHSKIINCFPVSITGLDDIFKLIAKYLLLILLIASIHSIIVVTKDELWKCTFSPFNLNALRHFYFSFQDYKFLYGTSLAIFSIYWSIITYSISKEDKIKKKEIEICDYYINNTLPLISRLISKLNEKGILLIDNNPNKQFYSEEFSSINLAKHTVTIKVLSTDSEVQILNIEALSCLNYFSYRILNSKIEIKMAYEMFGEAFISQVSALYPSISVARSKYSAINHFDSIVKLFHEWNNLKNK